MYGASYAEAYRETMGDSPAIGREREREAFDRAIELMKRADAAEASAELRWGGHELPPAPLEHAHR